MRIRKRAVPLPLSLLTPVPFSDLHHHHHHLVQLPSSSQPTSDHDLPSNDLLHRPICYNPPPPLRSIHLKASEDEKIKAKEQRDESSMSSKQSESSAVTDNGVHTGVFGTMDGRWCDGDKAIPLKKRKASLEMNGMVVTGEAKMKSKTNKKCLVATTSEEDDREKDDEDYDDDDDYEEDDKKSKKSRGATKKNTRMKKKKKGGSIMEGSRCSRVNGRGWRCMQATLVGYSLCEHHLGKGRLRSISSVRARSSPVKTTPLIPTSPVEKPCNAELGFEAEKQDSDIDNQKKLISGKKRMRIGMVKARSLSSLLCQPNTSVLHQIN